MEGVKIFLLVFSAALVADLVADPLRVFWHDLRTGSIVLPWQEPPAEVRPEGTGVVIFANKTGRTAVCDMRKDGAYAQFLRLMRKESKRFDRFELGAAIRCYTQLDNRSATILTYFGAEFAGRYELMLDRVPCPSCTGQDWRWATVIVDPNGNPYYTKYANE